MSEDSNYYTIEDPGGEQVYIQNRVVNNRLLNQERFKNGGGGYGHKKHYQLETTESGPEFFKAPAGPEFFKMF